MALNSKIDCHGVPPCQKHVHLTFWDVSFAAIGDSLYARATNVRMHLILPWVLQSATWKWRTWPCAVIFVEARVLHGHWYVQKEFLSADLRVQTAMACRLLQEICPCKEVRGRDARWILDYHLIPFIPMLPYHLMRMIMPWSWRWSCIIHDMMTIWRWW